MNSVSEDPSFSAKGNPSIETVTDASEQSPTDEGHEELPLDAVFAALKNARRRQVIRHLNEQDGPVSLSDLSEHVAAIENGTTPEEIDSKQRKRVYVGLYQSHLPKLDEMGVIVFDEDRGSIELGPAASQLDEYLSPESEDGRPWYYHHLGFLTTSALVLLLGAAVGVVGVGAAVMLFAGIGASVAVLAAFHAYGQQ
jgi:DNA-binding transcriptional ArsR family regulator